jgi:hypothetical protein
MNRKLPIYIFLGCLVFLVIMAISRSIEFPSNDIEESQELVVYPENDVEDEARDLCVSHDSDISMHIHPELSIYVNSTLVEIPSDIGITSDCMKAVHTHDETGKIHLEYPTEHDFTLEDFFANWGETFSSTELLGLVVDEYASIRLVVDGEESDAFENLILEDHQQIEIYYTDRASDTDPAIN